MSVCVSTEIIWEYRLAKIDPRANQKLVFHICRVLSNLLLKIARYLVMEESAFVKYQPITTTYCFNNTTITIPIPRGIPDIKFILIPIPG